MTAPIQKCPEQLLAHAIGFTNIRGPLECVSKAFYAAKRRALQNEWRAGLLLSHHVIHVTPEQTDQLEHEIDVKANAHYPPEPEIAHAWADYVNFQNCSRSIFARALELPAPFADKARGRRQEHLAQVSDMLDQRPVRFRAIAQLIHEFNAQESLFVRERSIALLPGCDPENPNQILRAFQRLHQEQREEVSETFQGRRDFEKLPGGLTLERNRKVERVVQKMRAEMERNLFSAWNYIRNAIHPLPADAPAANARSPAIRQWLNNPANQPHLDRIGDFFVNGISALPPEIVKLRYLTHLTVEGVRELPAFLAKLRYLESCFVQDNGLRLFSISDECYRHMESMLYCWEQEAGGITASIDHVEEIPFRMWFKREFTIGHDSWTVHALDGLSHWLRAEFDPDCANCLFELLIRLFAPLILVLMAFDLLFNITAFLLNLLMIDCIEPIVTLARDRLGYSRMVKIG